MYEDAQAGMKVDRKPPIEQLISELADSLLHLDQAIDELCMRLKPVLSTAPRPEAPDKTDQALQTTYSQYGEFLEEQIKRIRNQRLRVVMTLETLEV